MPKKVSTSRKIHLLRRMILRQHIVNMILTLHNLGEATARELRQHEAKKTDRTLDLLAITERKLDENHLVKYKLTKKGERLATALEQLLELLDEFLPEDN